MVRTNLRGSEFTSNFALEMVRAALGSTRHVWDSHQTTPQNDDLPERRHLKILVRRHGIVDFEAEVWVHAPQAGPIHGSVILGVYGESNRVYMHHPEEFFIYGFERGVEKVRKVAVEVKRATVGFIAQVLDNPDSTPSIRDERESRLPQAQGTTAVAALGKLVMANPDLFRVVIRHEAPVPVLV